MNKKIKQVEIIKTEKYRNIQSNIKSIIKTTGVNYTEFSLILNFEHNYFSNILSSRKEPNLSCLIYISIFLGIPLKHLVNDNKKFLDYLSKNKKTINERVKERKNSDRYKRLFNEYRLKSKARKERYNLNNRFYI